MNTMAALSPGCCLEQTPRCQLSITSTRYRVCKTVCLTEKFTAVLDAVFSLVGRNKCRIYRVSLRGFMQLRDWGD